MNVRFSFLFCDTLSFFHFHPPTHPLVAPLFHRPVPAAIRIVLIILFYVRWINIKAPKTYAFLGLSKGVGFIRFDQRCEAERAIKELNGTIPKNSTEAITVKFANNPSNNKAMAPLAAYLTPQTARRFPGPIHHTTGRFRYNTNGFERFSIYLHSISAPNCLSNLLIL